jgi:hypothetical protein
MTPETVGKLEEAFSMGFTDIEACLFANIHKDTLYAYCNAHPEFSDRKEELKNHPTLLAKRNVIDGLRDGDQKISQWYLERKAPEFKNKQELTADVTATVNAPTTIVIEAVGSATTTAT